MQFFETTNLGLISALIARGYSPEGRHIEGKQVVFTFEKDEEFMSAVEDYKNNRFDVDAKTFYVTSRSVKNDIYQMLRGEQ